MKFSCFCGKAEAHFVGNVYSFLRLKKKLHPLADHSPCWIETCERPFIPKADLKKSQAV